MAGVQVDLSHDAVALDDRASEWRGLYGGPAAAIIAVAAIERIHSPAALLDHPGLTRLRADIDKRLGTGHADQPTPLPNGLS